MELTNEVYSCLICNFATEEVMFSSIKVDKHCASTTIKIINLEIKTIRKYETE